MNTNVQQGPICPICGKPANKTNTHLIPWFVIKHTITHKGAGDDNKELSFTLSTDRPTKMYTGRSVLPESIEEFGDLHAVEKETENPYSRDYLWCSTCETKFSRLEAIFASRFKIKNMRQLQHKLPLYHDQRLMIDVKFNQGLYELFIQSIFWRCSFGKFDGFKLGHNIEAKLLHNLQKSFSIQNFLKLKAADELLLPHSFPLITAVLDSEEGADTTTDIIMINKVKTPYFIMAGKWLFQLFEKESHIKGTQERLYGLRDAMDLIGLYPYIASKAHVALLDKDTTEKFIQNRLSDFAERKVRGIQRNIRDAHMMLFDKKPDAFIVSYVQQQFFTHLKNGKTEFNSFVHAMYDLKKLA